MSPQVRNGLIVLLACTVAFVASGWAMARRVGAFNKAMPPLPFHFEANDSRELTINGRLTRLDDAILPDGTPGLTITYGDKTRAIPVHAPAVRDLPELNGYTEWLRLIAFVPVVDNHPLAGPVRTVLVSRNVAKDRDSAGWGAVFVKNWTFDFYEFMPDGTIDHHLMQFKAQNYHTKKWELPAADKGDKDHPNPDYDPRIEPIEERTWQWQAALFALPTLQISRYRFSYDAVDGSDKAPGMGWTLPAAGFSCMGMMIGIAMLMATRVKPPEA